MPSKGRGGEIVTIGGLRQQMLDLGFLPALADARIEAFQKCIAHYKRDGVVDLSFACRTISQLLSIQKTGLRSSAERRKENRDLTSGGIRQNRSTGQVHFFRPFVLPNSRGTDRRADLKSELMHHFLYFDGRKEMLRAMSEQLISWGQAAKITAEILLVFDLEKRPLERAKAVLRKKILADNRDRRWKGESLISAEEARRMADSEGEKAALDDIAFSILGEKIFDQYKTWNPRQISGLPRGVYSSRTQLRPDGKRELIYSTKGSDIKKSQKRSRFHPDVAR